MDSMNGLIAITEKEVGARYEQCVDGRDLHEFLEVGKVFPAWIRERIEAYGFQEDQDYAVFSEIGNNPQGGRPYIKYTLTLDMAKELCMIERNEKGRQARKYFIEIEKRARDMEKAQAEREPGIGVLHGIKLSRVLQRNGFDLADAARLVWYRSAELTQAEAAKLFDVSTDKVKEVERALKEVGIEFPAIKANKRSKEMRELLDNMLGFRDNGLQLVKGGVC